MTTMGVSGWMFLLVSAHPGCPGQNPESHEKVVVATLQTVQLGSYVSLPLTPWLVFKVGRVERSEGRK